MKNKIKDRLYASCISWKTGNIAGGTGSSDVEFKKATLFHKDFKNFGRLDDTSKAVCAAIATILKLKNLYPAENKLNIPVYLASTEGPLSSDYAYYSDFLQFGGTAGRANLFVYTLPSSPLGEASVHFGLTGNLLFVNSENSLQTMCTMIMDSRKAGDQPIGYLAGFAEQTTDSVNTLFIFFEANKDSSAPGLSIEEIAKIKFANLHELKNKIPLKGSEIN